MGVSQCLLGEEVRYDGGHKRDTFVVETLAPYFQFVPVCPEVEAGMGTPREPIRLVQIGDQIRIRGVKSQTEWTDQLSEFSAQRAHQLMELDLCGYVLKKDSPSCGWQRVRVHQTNGQVSRTGRGVFAHELVKAMPDLPVEEEGRLCDPAIRDNWIERVFAYDRLKELWKSWSVGALIEFHARHKLSLLAHSPATYKRLGRLVAESKSRDRGDLQAEYEREFMEGMSRIATRGRHVNVLQHMLGYFTEKIDEADRRELCDVIDDYGRGLVPLIVPITLVNHYVRRFDIKYLQQQTYLHPHPKELMLRNHV